MRKDVLAERDEALKEKKNALKESFFNFGTSDKFAFWSGVIAIVLAIVYFTRVFSDSGYDRITRVIESTALWLFSFKYYFTKKLQPDSRSARWLFRVMFIISIISTIYLILGRPGPRLPWKDW